MKVRLLKYDPDFPKAKIGDLLQLTNATAIEKAKAGLVQIVEKRQPDSATARSFNVSEPYKVKGVKQKPEPEHLPEKENTDFVE